MKAMFRAWHVTRDTWHVTCDTWHVTRSEHSLHGCPSSRLGLTKCILVLNVIFFVLFAKISKFFFEIFDFFFGRGRRPATANIFLGGHGPGTANPIHHWSLYKLGTFFFWKNLETSIYLVKMIGRWIPDSEGRGIARNITKNIFFFQTLQKR